MGIIVKLVRIMSLVLGLSHVGNLCADVLSVSQAGQDRWAIEEVFNFKTNGYFVDIGAVDGYYISNTYILEKFWNWQGICVEANPIWIRGLNANRSCIKINACLDYTNHEIEFRCHPAGLVDGIIGDDTDNKKDSVPPDSDVLKMQTKTLEQVLDECNAPHVIDFLSIDVEGAETRIFKNFPFHKYTFLSMCVERPTLELHNQLCSEGYVFVKKGLFDFFYLHHSIPNFEGIKKEPF